MPRTIRAARLIGLGEPVRLEQIELPDPGPDEVVVELAAAGVNPVDRYTAEGRVAPAGPLPRTLGIEGAGWVDGAPVTVASVGGLGATRDGTWAQAMIVPRDRVVALDPAVDLHAAASLGVAGITALNVVDLAELTPADRVLVLGAAGGVGLPIVSLVRSAGARVLGQAGSPGKADAVRDSGGEAVVADADSLADAVRDFAPTVVFDPLGGAFTPAALSVLAPQGRHVLYGVSAGPQATIALQPVYRNSQRILGYGGLGLSDAERHASAQAAASALADGRLNIPVGRVIALSDVADVFDALADRSLAGKLVIDCTR
jgi:NADPH2:quinone reductase